MKIPSGANFFMLLYEAHDASEKVDNFDLNSDDPKNKNEFSRLWDEQYNAVDELIKFIKQHDDDILKTLRKMD
jgi:hypothetical protein